MLNSETCSGTITTRACRMMDQISKSRHCDKNGNLVVVNDTVIRVQTRRVAREIVAKQPLSNRDTKSLEI